MGFLFLPPELWLCVGPEFCFSDIWSLYTAFKETRYENYMTRLTGALVHKYVNSLLISGRPDFSLTIAGQGHRPLQEKHWLNGKGVGAKVPRSSLISSSETKDWYVDMKIEFGSPSDEDVFDSPYNGRRPSGISKFVISFPDCYCVADGPSLKLEFVGIPSEQAQSPYSNGWPTSFRARLCGRSAYYTTKEMPWPWCREILAKPIDVRLSLEKDRYKYYMDDLTLVIYGLDGSPLTEVVGGRSIHYPNSDCLCCIDIPLFSSKEEKVRFAKVVGSMRHRT